MWQLDVDGLPTEFAPLRSLEAHPSNLPAETTRLVDRDAERARVRGLLDSAAVATVTGPGGIGKTRVALAVAHDLLPAMLDGVFHVDAATIESADRLADELATVAGVRIAPGQEQPRRSRSTCGIGRCCSWSTRSTGCRARPRSSLDWLPPARASACS